MNRKKLIFFVLSIFFTAANFFCQDSKNQSEESSPEDLAEEESLVDQSLQRNLNVFTSSWQYNLNPHTAQYASEAQVLNSLYEGLFCYNPMTGEAIKAYCSSYKLSRDKKRWTFTIRDGAKFSNGDEITAETFKESWLNLMANPAAEYASFADCIQGAKEYRTGKGKREDVRISVNGKNTLVLHLTTPTEHLPQMLCHHSFAAVSTKENVFSGPYILKSYKDDVITLLKNENYIDCKKVHLPSVTITMLSNFDELSHKFNTGDADLVLKNADYTKVIDSSAVQMSAQFGTQYYFFKMNDNVWSKKEFRRALVEAIPYDQLRSGFYLPAETLVYPLTSYPAVVGFSDYDTQDAIALMDEARQKNNISKEQKLPLVISISSDVKWELDAAIILKNAWEPLGVEVSIQSLPSSLYLSSISTSQADLFLYGWIGDYADPLAFLELFKSDSSLNVSKYNNAKYDSLLSLAASANSTQEHYDYQAEAEQILLDEGEVIPLTHFVSLNLIDTQMLGGWYKNSMDIHPFKYMYFMKKEFKLPGFVRWKM